jgi:Ca2+-binding RTX toxin-like protein
MNLEIVAYSLETSNGDTNSRTVPFTVNVSPAADLVIVDPLNVTTAEDTPVALQLRLLLEDTQAVHPTENPAEVVEITFTGLPAGSALTGGGTIFDLGGGAWRFTGTQAQANALLFSPPANYAGPATINLSAVSIDGASVLGTPATDSFQVTVTPVADAPVLQTNPITGLTGEALPVNLFASLQDADGSETLSVTLSGVPSGTTFSSGTDLGGGGWRFTPAQLSGLTMTLAGGASSTTISVSATATETASGATAVSNGSIMLTVGGGGMTLGGTTIGDLLTGGVGNDTIDGGGGADTISGGQGADLLIGGAGADLLTGGAGADTYRYLAGHAAGGPDTITDFTAGPGGDAIDIEALLPTYDGNPATLSNFVNLLESGGDTTVRIDPTGGGSFTTAVMTLLGVTGLDLAALRTNGNLIA